MAMISRFTVDRFRGINSLKVENLNQINLFVGDNNSGKTSVLEAIQFFRTSSLLGNAYRIARQRESIAGISSAYESFMCMFPRGDNELRISISGSYDNKEISFTAVGEQARILMDAKEIERIRGNLFRAPLGETEADSFKGKLSCMYDGQLQEEEIEINSFSRMTGIPTNKNNETKIVYVAPFEHLRGSVINQIIKNEGYKEICLRAIQLFDPDIEDMMIFKSEVGNYPVEYLKHRKLGNMPLATFGDGIKKVLVLSNAIAKATGGVLLIDEIETAIHKKYYDDIFNFIVKACKTFKVQLFITTHSLEAIDGLLATQNYEKQQAEDRISVVTLKKEAERTYSRVLSGRDVALNREAFGFEVRL